MTFQVHPPHPTGQCFGPKCTAPASEKDRGLIPRFCSDPCRDRFVDEHALRSPAADVIELTTIEVHDGEQWRPLPGVKKAVLVTTTSPADPDRRAATCPAEPDPAEVQQRVRELVDALAPVAREIGLVLQRAFEAVRPAIEQLHAFACNTPPTDPRARALWLRQNRNTGPAAKPQRAPRVLDTTSRRRTR